MRAKRAHTYPLTSGRHRLHCAEPPTAPGFVDQHSHRPWRADDELLDDARRDPADAFGLAAVVAERELVEVGLQVLVAHRAGVRAEQPAFEQRDRPVAALHGVVLAPLGLGLHDGVVRPLLQTLLIVAGVSVCHDVRVGGDLARREQLGLEPTFAPPGATWAQHIELA